MTTAAHTARPAEAAPIDCETAVRRLWDYLDGQLSAVAHDAVEAHLATCALCPPHFDFSRRMRDALAALGSRTPPPEGDDDSALRARVAAALRRTAAG